jgi:SAM-dependent methyltransferase
MHPHEYEAMYSLENFYWWFVARRILAKNILVNEVDGRKSVRILDVGCGTGANMNAFSELGSTIGLDSSIEALKFCHTRGLERLVHSGVEKLPFANDAFEIVTALDVLEHTDDDLLALQEIQRVCARGGLLLITVPAYGFLWSEHDEALKHRRRYSAQEIRNKLTLTGFEVIRTSYFITTLFFPILALRIWNGIVKKSTHPRTSHYLLPRWLNSALIGLLDVERKVFQRLNLPFGVSIIAIARPRRDETKQ